MQIPKRKSGKYTNYQSDPNITQSKFLELQNELNRLKKSLPKAASELKRTAEMGDLSENAAYTIAKGRLRYMNERILELESIIKKAIIIKPNNSGVVGLGSVVTLEFNNRLVCYTILGSSETNPSLGIISNQSPLGQALIGHKIGDVIRTTIANKITEYNIISIN